MVALASPLALELEPEPEPEMSALARAMDHDGSRLGVMHHRVQGREYRQGNSIFELASARSLKDRMPCSFLAAGPGEFHS